jgi:uncharacterized membrane protein YbhN (UPF0104 family)
MFSGDQLLPVRRALVRVAFTLALFAVVLFAVQQLVPGAGHRLAHADAGWLAAALGLELLACVSYVVLFEAVLSRKPWRVSARRGTEIALGEIGGFAILPTGIGGPAVRVWGLRASAMPWRVLIVRSISHGVIFNVPYTAAAVALGVGVSLRLVPGHAPVLTALAPLGLVLLTCALAAGSVWLVRATEARRGGRFRRVVRWVIELVPEALLDLRAVARRPQALLGATGWWAGDCAALWAGFQAVGGRPALSVLVLAYMLGQLGNNLPLPGGVGGVEPLMLGIFAASGVNLGLAGAAIIVYRTISLGVQGAVGALGVVGLASDLRTERRRNSEKEAMLRPAEAPGQ